MSCASSKDRSTRLRTLHSAGLRGGCRGTLLGRTGWPRRRRWRTGRTETGQHFLGKVEVLVGGNDDARLILGIEDHRVPLFGPQLVDHLVDLLHDRTNELGLTRAHL